MTIKTDPADELIKAGSRDVITWGEKYITGIAVIDYQHRELVNLTNYLFLVCLSGREGTKTVFKEAMHRTLEYIRFHSSAEQKLLERIKYPLCHEHKKEHKILVRKILEAAKDFDTGKIFTPNCFVQILKEWVFGHIAVSDKSYATYVAEQKQKGLLTDRQIMTP